MNQEYKILIKVYEIRKQILFNSTTSEIRNILLKDSQLFNKVDEQLPLFKQMKQDRQLFSFYLFIKATSCWEGYSLNEIGLMRFPKQCYDVHFHRFCVAHYSKFMFTIIYQVHLEIFEDYSIMDKAKNNLKNNIKILKEIVQIDITFQDLDEYFQNLKIYSFNCEILQKYLHGFSSYDGKYVYISLKEMEDKPLTEIIECQVVDHIYFWLIKNENPLLIMSEINNLFFGEYNLQYEPSDYYLRKAYNRLIQYDGPFKMSTINQLWII